jgi:hypothetical protein
MEKLMRKTDDTSRPSRFEDHDTLADTELDAVTGGTLPGLGPLVTEKTADSLGDALVTVLSWLGP